MREIDEKAVEAAADTSCLNGFILEYEGYIIRCASKTAKRYISKSDDEWAIAMEAFCSAVHSYSYEKGSFLKFAELIIARRLIDFFRKQNRHQPEFSVSPDIFSGETEEEGENYLLAAEIVTKTNISRQNSLKEEIEGANQQFSVYGFSFYDLISVSPKSQKTKEACYTAVTYIASSPLLIGEMRRTKNLPLKIIEKNAKIPRKILERHRKYIIAAVEIVMGDYPGLSEYMRSFKEEKIR